MTTDGNDESWKPQTKCLSFHHQRYVLVLEAIKFWAEFACAQLVVLDVLTVQIVQQGKLVQEKRYKDCIFNIPQLIIALAM